MRLTICRLHMLSTPTHCNFLERLSREQLQLKRPSPPYTTRHEVNARDG